MKTKDKLAKVLGEAGLTRMAESAASGFYDDFESPLAAPISQLVMDLRRASRYDLAKRAINGEWDATKEESDEWFEREGKDFVKGWKK